VSAFDVITVGTDSSGRKVRMTRFAKAAFDLTCHIADVVPIIVQGGFQGDGGAEASAGTHNLAGCIDTRTWDLTDSEVEDLIWAGASIGVVLWYRKPPTFDEHAHWLVLGDRPMHPDAEGQVREYLAGGDGLVGGSPDPHRELRPHPLVTRFDYDAATKVLAEEDDMQLNDKLFPDREDSPTIRETLVAANQANRKLDKVLERLADFREMSAERDRALAADVERLVEASADVATKEQLRAVARRLRAEDDTDPDPMEG